jgi:hypothetical protein
VKISATPHKHVGLSTSDRRGRTSPLPCPLCHTAKSGIGGGDSGTSTKAASRTGRGPVGSGRIPAVREMAVSICRAILPLTFGFDQNAGTEDQSHAGGSSGSRGLSMAASTSLAKSASMTAVESSGKSAMHSEMVRRGGAGAWITATGNLSLSITTSAPARTRASASGKLLAASASEMWITCTKVNSSSS